MSSGTITRNSDSGTIAHAVSASMASQAYAVSGTATYTNASTFYIAGAPTAGTGVTITNPWAFYLSSGNAYFGGNVGIGTTAPGSLFTVQNSGTTANMVQLSSKAATNVAPGGTINGIDFVSNDDQLGAATVGASIQALGGTHNHTSTNVGSALSFSTVTDLTTTLVERMRITDGGFVGIGTSTPATALQVSGVISPATDNANTLGSASYRFTTVYATNSTINTSDVREKKEIKLSDLGLDFITKLRPVSYKWKNGPDNEVHYGLIAQETEKIIKDSLEKSSGEKSQVPIVDHDKTTDKYGLRYTEFISPIIKSIQELYSKWFEDHQVIAEQKRQLASLKEETKSLKSKVEEMAQFKNIEKQKNNEIQDLKLKVKMYEQQNLEMKKRLDQIEKKLNSK